MTRTGMMTLVLLATIAGCKKDPGSADQGAASVKEGSAEAPVETGPDLGSYVFCFNELDSNIRDVWNRYIKWVDPVEGPNEKTQFNSMDAIYDYASNKCFEELDASAKRNEASTLGPLTKAYREQITKLIPITVAAVTYYEHGDYKDDGFAKGKELHKQLADGFAAWNDAAGALRAAWETLHREQRIKDLAALEKEEGRKSERFVTSQVMNRAEVLIEAVSEEVPTAQLVAALESYQAAFAEMDAFFGPELTGMTDSDRNSFKYEADLLLIQTKEAMRALKAGPTLPADGDGSAERFSERYNALVKRSNGITWD